MFSNVPIVDFGLSFGGDATIRGSVSRIDVREGVMKLPVSVTSQYRRFCGILVQVLIVWRDDVKAYLFIIDDHPFSLRYVNAISRS